MAGTPLGLRELFDRLYAAYGPQHWWPGETPFEVMVGAVLTQNTAWTNVEKAIANLVRANCLDPACIVRSDPAQLAEWLRPSGYFNVKADRLQSFCRWYLERGGYHALAALDTHTLRAELLRVRGVGPETADDILLYAFDRPVFVIDAYTRRLLERLGLAAGGEGYEQLRELFEATLGPDEHDPAGLYNEYHALVVIHAKQHCRKRPACAGCPVADRCPGEGPLNAKTQRR